MESSDESFLWTDASDDFDSDTKMVTEEKCDIESESGYSYKKKIQKELFNSKNEENVTNSVNKSSTKKKSKKRKLSESENFSFNQTRKKHIKSEPESDIDKSQKNNSTLCDEDFLNNKVKEEQISREKEIPKLKTKKNKKHATNDDAPDQTESIAFLDPLDNCTVISISESNYAHNESNFKEALVKDSIRTKKKKSKKIKDQKHCASDTFIENNSTDITAEDNTMDSAVLNKFCKKEAKGQIFHNNLSASEENQSIIEKEYNSDISKINTSQLNTTASKKLKSTLLSNGGSNDIILSCGGVNSKLSQRMSNIADRIRFEVECSTSDINNDNRTYAKPQCSVQLQKYLKTNGLVCVPSLLVSDCVISEDDEVWVLKGPSEIDVKGLLGSSIILDSKCKLKMDSQTYVGLNESSANNATILTMNDNNPVIKNIPVNGLIQFHKRIPKPHFVQEYNVINTQPNFIPLPETKYRHPLFGVNYKKCIKVPKHIAKRLRSIVSECTVKDIFENPKKNKQKIESDLLCNKSEFKVEEEGRDKKKKRKCSLDSTTPPKSAKRRKHNIESADTWESEKAIEQQLFSF